eukprot:jgi/Astpho2/2082/fgenesh1_pg.00038_%23_155_t
MEGSDLKPANPFGLGFSFDPSYLEPLPLIGDTKGPESNLSWDAVVSAVEPDVLADFKGAQPTYPDMDLSALQRDKATSSSGNSLDAAGTAIPANGLLEPDWQTASFRAFQHRLEQAERLNAQLEAKVAQLELQQKSLQAQNEILSKVAQMRQGVNGASDSAPQPAPLAEASAEDQLVAATERLLIKGWGVGQTVRITVKQPWRTVTRQAIRDMSKEEFRELYNTYVNEIAAALVESAGDENHPGRKRITELSNESEVVFVIKALGCSDHLHFVRSVNIGCGTNHWKGISQNQAYWESVVRAINLTPAQVEDCIALRVCYLQKLAQVLKRRKQITTRLAWVEDHSLSHTDATLRFDQASNDMRSLKDSFQEEYRLFMHIYAIQSQGIRTGYQSGVATVQCHPWCPDGVGIMDYLAHKAGHPPANVVMEEEVNEDLVDLRWAAMSSYVDSLSPAQLDDHVSVIKHLRQFLLAHGAGPEAMPAYHTDSCA